MSSEWDAVIKEWLVDSGYIWGGALMGLDGVVYSACSDLDDGWASFAGGEYDYAETKEDETVENVHIVEATTIKEAVANGQSSTGVFLGGVKYKCIKKDEMEYNDNTYEYVLLAKPKGGAYLFLTKENIVVCAFDEEREQDKATSLTTGLAFAEYLVGSGY